MQSTINSAIKNACTQLHLPSDYAERVVARLWRPSTPPVTPAPAPAPAPNIEKLNRQQAQRLEQMEPDADERELHKSFLAHVNRMPAEFFKSLSLLEHMENFISPPRSNAGAGGGGGAPPPPSPDTTPVPRSPSQIPDEEDDEELVEVNYHLREYDVGINTHRVYEMRKGVHVFVGMLGKNEFKDMVMPELD
jgi:hypothetical protein